jgi:CheY-like chemotaxis protein
VANRLWALRHVGFFRFAWENEPEFALEGMLAMFQSTLTCSLPPPAVVLPPSETRPGPAAYRYDLLRIARATARETRPRVLIVEDNADAGKMLTLLLRAKGWRCELCTVSTEASNVIDTYRPAVILLDIAMPGLNGLSLARLIRARDEGRQYVLIGLSGFARLEDEQRALAAGIDTYHLKPANVDALLASIPELLAAKRPAAACSTSG